jgi:hypothetical protein
VGFGTQPNCDVDVELCAVGDAFYSEDGISWSTAVSNDAFTDALGRTILMTAVTPYAGGFVATGSIIDRATEVVVGGVWVSDDGTAWSKVNMPPIDLGAAHNICEGAGYVIGNLGMLAAVGSRLLAYGFRDGPKYCHSKREYFVLGSDDGTTWLPVALPDLGSGGYVVSLQGGSQFVMTSQRAGHLEGWTSPDGSEWTKGSTEFPNGGVLPSIVETPDGYLTFLRGGSSPPYSLIVLGSADGLRWGLVANEQLPSDWEPVTDAVLVGSTVVTLGWFGRNPPGDFESWVVYGIRETTNGVTWQAPETDAFAGYYLWSLIYDGTSVLIRGESFTDLQDVLFVKSSW